MKNQDNNEQEINFNENLDLQNFYQKTENQKEYLSDSKLILQQSQQNLIEQLDLEQLIKLDDEDQGNKDIDEKKQDQMAQYQENNYFIERKENKDTQIQNLLKKQINELFGQDNMGEIQEWAFKTTNIKKQKNQNEDDSGYEDEEASIEDKDFEDLFNKQEARDKKKDYIVKKEEENINYEQIGEKETKKGEEIKSIEQFEVKENKKEIKLHQSIQKSNQIFANTLQSKANMIKLQNIEKNQQKLSKQGSNTLKNLMLNLELTKNEQQDDSQLEKQNQQKNDNNFYKIEEINKINQKEQQNIKLQTDNNMIEVKKNIELLGKKSEIKSPFGSQRLWSSSSNINEEEDTENVQQMDEWEEINKNTLQQILIQKQKNSHFTQIYFIFQYNFKLRQSISFIEAWNEIKQLNLSIEKGTIQVEDNSYIHFLTKLLYMCNNQSKISSISLLDERDQIFAFAKIQFDVNNELHHKMLFSVYTGILKEEGNNYGRYGCKNFIYLLNNDLNQAHWEKIGFQGNDPATDLRGVGMLGLLQIIALINFQPELMQQLYKISTSKLQHFPFCCSLLNMTELVLNAIRTGNLNNQINKNQSVINVINNFYFSLIFKFYNEYLQQKYTIKDYGKLKNKMQQESLKNPLSIYNNFIQKINMFKKQNCS